MLVKVITSKQQYVILYTQLVPKKKSKCRIWADRIRVVDCYIYIPSTKVKKNQKKNSLEVKKVKTVKTKTLKPFSSLSYGCHYPLFEVKPVDCDEKH